MTSNTSQYDEQHLAILRAIPRFYFNTTIGILLRMACHTAAVSWERRRSQNVQSYSFPNILLDGWEGLKACTFEKRQSKGAHFEKNFRRAKRGEITSHFFRRASRGAAWPLHFKFASYAYAWSYCSYLQRTLLAACCAG